jgi:predicted RNA-binding Zn-ribbon protein involved in translation (DUF1610 family)
VTITAADITIPTTLDLNAAPQCLPSLEEARKHRAQQARHQTSACPHCGEWAIVETVTVNRPGLPGVVQTLSRCQRNPRWQEERCPLTILSEEWAEETPAPVAEEEESMERTCETCGADIAHRGARARMCAPCAAAKKVERDRQHNMRMSEARKSKRVVQDPAPQNVPHPVPSALRVSVLTLAQQATDNAGTRALLRDALALSPERQDLLRRLLDDVEVA